jgi:hypothetical protein
METTRTTPNRPIRTNPDRPFRSTTSGRSARLLALPLLATAGVAVLASPPAGAKQPGVPVPPPITCGSVITTDVRLTADLIDCPGSGLVVGAPGITIDLGGHVIDGTGIGAGVDDEAGHDDVRITNGTVREFVFGVNLFEVSDSRVDRIAAIDNLDGVKVARADDLEIDRVAASDNVGAGVEITFSEGVTVRRSAAAGNGLWGVVDRFSEGSRFVDNVFVANEAPGLTIDRTGGAVAERNMVMGNSSDGIELVALEDARIARNLVVLNHGNGISVDQAGNTLTANWAIGNGGIGIAAADGTIDGGRNHATGNVGGDCTGVSCR